MIPLLKPERRWECPNCDFTDVTHEAAQHSRFHACRGLKGLTAPMVPSGVKAKVQTVVRDDYINGESVAYDPDGKPVMSVVTVRDDGQDCTVFAPTAVATKREGME